MIPKINMLSKKKHGRQVVTVGWFQLITPVYLVLQTQDPVQTTWEPLSDERVVVTVEWFWLITPVYFVLQTWDLMQMQNTDAKS